MVNVNKLTRKKLGEILKEEGLVKEEQIQQGLKRQQENGQLLGEALVALGFLTEHDIARVLVKQFGLPYMDASTYNIDRKAFDGVSPKIMWDNQFVVLDRIGKVMTLAVSGVMKEAVFEEIERATGSQLFLYVSTVSQVRAALEKHVPQDGKK